MVQTSDSASYKKLTSHNEVVRTLMSDVWQFVFPTDPAIKNSFTMVAKKGNIIEVETS